MAQDEVCGLAIVTGAGLNAERHDRPLAYALRERIAEAAPEIDAVVCGDLQYLNDAGLRETPTISVGGPAANALSAYLIARLPSVLAVDGVYAVLMDVDAMPPLACCWGRDAGATAAAVEGFAARHLGAFLEACRG